MVYDVQCMCIYICVYMYVYIHVEEFDRDNEGCKEVLVHPLGR